MRTFNKWHIISSGNRYTCQNSWNSKPTIKKKINVEIDTAVLILTNLKRNRLRMWRFRSRCRLCGTFSTAKSIFLSCLCVRRGRIDGQSYREILCCRTRKQPELSYVQKRRLKLLNLFVTQIILCLENPPDRTVVIKSCKNVL